MVSYSKMLHFLTQMCNIHSTITKMTDSQSPLYMQHQTLVRIQSWHSVSSIVTFRSSHVMPVTHVMYKSVHLFSHTQTHTIKCEQSAGRTWGHAASSQQKSQYKGWLLLYHHLQLQEVMQILESSNFSVQTILMISRM